MAAWITRIMERSGYLGITLIENVFLPLPSELIIPAAGFAAAPGELTIWGVFLVATSGSLAGALACSRAFCSTPPPACSSTNSTEPSRSRGAWLTLCFLSP